MDADGVLGGAEELGDFEGLFDPSEEQLDVPAALVEIGDVLGGGVEIVAEDAQDLAGLDADADFSDRALERIFAAHGLAGGQESDPVGEDIGVCIRGQLARLGLNQGRAGAESGDDAASGGIELGPPSVVIIAKIKDIAGTGLDGHILGGGDVVDVGRCDRRVDRPVGAGVIDYVDLGAAGIGGAGAHCSGRGCGAQ